MYFHKYNTRYRNKNTDIEKYFRGLINEAIDCTPTLYKEYNSYLTDKINKIKRIFDFISINLDFVNENDSLKNIIVYKIKEFSNGIENEYFNEYLYLLKLIK